MANYNKQHDFTAFAGTENSPNFRAFMESPVLSSMLNLFKSAKDEMAKLYLASFVKTVGLSLCVHQKKRRVLIDEYISLKPDDMFAEYAQLIILWRTLSKAKEGKNLLSDFESAKSYIKSGELLALKLSLNIDSQPCQRSILIDIYYYFGAKYVSTGQPERALDSFQKSFDLDNSNYSALYGIAYHHMQTDTDKAIELFKKFINMAPECEKQYPNAYYMIASLYLLKKNFDEALRYCSLAEKKRLPFIGPVDIPQKPMMQQMKYMIPQLEKMKME